VEVKRTRHAAYNINYHFVWCSKYRRSVLGSSVATRLEVLIKEKSNELGGEVLNLTVQPDHVHLFCSFPPSLAPSQIMRHSKGYTSHVLRREFSWLNSRLPSLWTRSYYIGTAGNVSGTTIQRYIEEQKEH
jgi:putative transposase